MMKRVKREKGREIKETGSWEKSIWRCRRVEKGRGRKAKKGG